jgi:predicted porin
MEIGGLFWFNSNNFLIWRLVRGVPPILFFSTLENFSMKKTLIALAAVAVSSAAMAQVTVDGSIDTAIGKIETSTNATGTVVKTDVGNQMVSGGMFGSRLRFGGAEDLGGGLKASFLLDHRFSSDTGVSTTPGFTGNSWVAVSGGFGTVTLGRSATAYAVADDLAASSAAGDTNNFTPDAMPGAATSNSNQNQIKYASPSFSGVSVAVSRGFDETVEAGSKDTNSFSLMYKTGPFSAAYGQQSAGGGDITNISAAYDLGVASVSFGTSTLKQEVSGVKGNKTTGNTLGVTVPMGAISLSAAYGSNEVKTAAGVKVSDKSGIGLLATYSLSKRTTVYGGMLNQDETTVTGNVKTTDDRVLFGMRHVF